MLSHFSPSHFANNSVFTRPAKHSCAYISSKATANADIHCISVLYNICTNLGVKGNAKCRHSVALE